METIGNKADTLYRRISESPISMTTHAYLNYIKRVSAKLKLNENEEKNFNIDILKIITLGVGTMFITSSILTVQTTSINYFRIFGF